jgi:hypothetical protein
MQQQQTMLVRSLPILLQWMAQLMVRLQQLLLSVGKEAMLRSPVWAAVGPAAAQSGSSSSSNSSKGLATGGKVQMR